MKKLSSIFLFALLATLVCFSGFSQSKSISKPHLQFNQLLEGLNNERVTAIEQDRYGFIWIGTYNGLHRYDGMQFKIYSNSGDSSSVPNSRIEKIFSDSKGNLWIGTANGLCKYNWQQDNFSRFSLTSGLVDPTDPSPNKITAITEDHDGTVWVGSAREGLLSFDEKKQAFAPFLKDKKITALSSMFVTEVCVGKNNDLWVGLNKGLNRVNTKTGIVTNYSNDPSSPTGLDGQYIRGLAMEASGDLWIGTWEKGLFLLKEQDQERKKFRQYQQNPANQHSLGNNSIFTIYIDHKNGVWVGNENGGLHLYDRQNDLFYRYLPEVTNPHSIASNSIWSIVEDRENRLWIGTASAGVAILDQHFLKFTHYYHSPLNPNGLNNNIISAFWEEKNGNVWIATDGGGINHWDRQKGVFTHYTHDPKNPHSIGSNAILDFSEDTQGRLWAGTWDGSLNILTDRQKMQFKKLKELQKEDTVAASVRHTFALMKDSKGMMWSGNFEGGLGAHNLETRSSQIYLNDPKDPQSLSNNTINTLLEDSKGTIWAGASFNGLNKIYINEEGKLVSKRFVPQAGDSASIIGDLINHVYEDRNKNIWVATDKGLSKLSESGKQINNYTANNGLPSDIIESIIEDHNGTLWIGTAKGLASFDPVRHVFKTFTVSDGVQGNKFVRHAVRQLRSGEILFGGTNGFNVFHPDSVKSNPHIPGVYLTDFKLFNKSIQIGEKDSILKAPITFTKEITLPYHQNILSFDFIALNYTHSTKNQYAFMLEGLETGWNYVGNQRSATYTNLDPGQYTFRVKAANNDGVWNEEGTALSIVITPPFWSTWWFRALLGLSVVFSALTFYKIRTNALKAQKAELEKQVKEKTADIQQANEDLLERHEEILQQQEELQAQAEIMQKTNDELSDRQKEILRQQHALKEQSKALQKTNERLSKSQEEIELQRDHLKIVNNQVMSSIQYAQTIQKAILPSCQKIAQGFPEHFILYRPKDVVSGDFYWFAQLTQEDSGLPSDLSFMAVVDCTGHGVPGAFMSIIGSTLLNEIINQKQITDPAEILEHLHQGVLLAVEKAEGINTAGMDVCLCQFERGEGNQVRILFSGAKRDLLYIRPGAEQVEKLAADRRSIGSDSATAFTTQELVLEAGSRLYFTTDGYTDQNNVEREKFGSTELYKLLEQICESPLAEQRQQLEAALDNHQQESEQRDDITIVGIKL